MAVVGQFALSTDVVVIGAGPGGYTAAVEAARHGRKVTVVERDRIGGTCLNVGCIPSKALIHVAESVHQARMAGQWGVDASPTVDLARAKAWSDGIVAELTGGVEKLLRSNGVTLIQGSAFFTGPRRLAVSTGTDVDYVEFGEAIVATGSQPVALPDLAFDGSRVLDSTAALALTAVPATIAVVGGGYIGVELGTAFAKLGARVTIVEALDRLLPELDSGLAAVVARRLGALDVHVATGAAAEGLDDAGLVLSNGQRIEAQVVIVAVGRRPITGGLGLELAGARVDERGFVEVDAARRAAAHLFAIGDITPGPALAHKASAEAAVAARAAAGMPAAFDPACIPMVVFSDPEVISVGATVAQAREAGVEVRSVKLPLRGSGRAHTLAATEGYVELVTDVDGTVLGGHGVGVGVSELAGELAFAVEMAASVADLALTIHPHPTLSESIMDAAQRLVPG